MKSPKNSPAKLSAKIQRLRPLVGVDMCACGPMNVLRCEGPCRIKHTEDTGRVVCSWLYQIDTSIFRTKKKTDRKRGHDDDEQFKSDLSKKRRFSEKRQRVRE